MPGSKVTEKEQAEKMKALRRELEDQLEEQLPPEMLESKPKVEVQVISGAEEIDPSKAKQVIEALLFASTKPITVPEIRKVLKSLTSSQIAEQVRALQVEYEQSQRSYEIREVANGFEVATRKEFAPWIMRIELQKKARQVTQSALETLAILAYKQPITRAEIEELRGVDGSGVLNTLMERDLIKIVGRKEVPGRPFMYGTTDKFLEHFGLRSIAELPSIEEIKRLVENSVNKEELLGRPQIVAIPQGTEAPAPAETGAGPAAEPAEIELVPAAEGPSSGEIEREPSEAVAYETETVQDSPPPVMGGGMALSVGDRL